VDIIPFGEIAGDDGKYRWPKEPEIEISILGFQEALDTAIECRISDDPIMQLKVAHPAVLILLKIFSWRDRKHHKRTDAQDVAYAMRYYTGLDENNLRIYAEPALYDGDFELDTIGARLAGRDLASLVQNEALGNIRAFIQQEIERGDQSEFLADMMGGSSKLFADESLYGHLLPNLAMGMDEV
jgi:predicted nucleotidyltransferase